MTILTTPRLILEPFHDSHFEGLSALNSDPAVMRYITGKAETRQETAELIQRVKARWQECGFSWWSLIDRDTGEVIGAGGVQYLEGDPTQQFEIGWRLRPDKWHRGFASEAARAMAGFAFEQLYATQLCAVCDPDNIASARVMQRLGMHYRGIEPWYNMNTAVYFISQAMWLEQSVESSERSCP